MGIHSILAKYLSENDFQKKITATFLVSAPYDDANSEYSLADFKLPRNLIKLAKQSDKIFLYQSKDDPVVPFADLRKYKQALPSANTQIFENRGHFLQEDFPELTDAILKLAANR
ncbi:hypothetical protein A2W54_02925 [Candidatus Giovannonibacteria bacterium RIFCSPHIGHO2_02_43_13]|uniref:AB hydrolase-1 domain-containing protein n=1 Tax=Candidatus Giovannonibacteria bacterium RIFCSPHIGHO2_02_43_13 TaxID=1798330 RepID=A0A1F5WPW4_9BACT|nr:MAG: hypothetical protein A3E06_03905 [Candidatus Giovannonibacteria bacterium RIFCSPHIGHO2_12_FULL_44_42]OGF77696.1 MAG: hypothetical protein A2W54_02925 [Candidatus Giovannonibacteria bacterium RIFCSPHIGHO2_02_43_13]OGF88958.1 MAG: hypothetical protein A3I94_03565 [Candidatus Giovannonibacteria bacterium RIFCSPLOWO2_02_FULL_43_54]OGF97395.1 MAG: hypothetical protein A3H08_03915 [Candidatus Giovannonibacteria bacterium RIFCSPLOWO2_12_FULL_44_32]